MREKRSQVLPTLTSVIMSCMKSWTWHLPWNRKIEVDKTVKDYIKIEYAGGGNLYILATQLELIQKYAGADAKKPKLNKLGGQEWNKTKTKVRGAVKEIAQDLVNFMHRDRIRRDLSTGRIPSGRESLRKCFRLRKRRIRSLQSRRPKRYGEHKDHGPPDLWGCRLRQDGDRNPCGL